MNTSTRTGTVSAGKTALAIVAILSLLLSLFAIASPAMADHLPPDGPAVTPTPQEFPGGDPICPAGTAADRFNSPTAGQFHDVLLSDGTTAKVTIVSTTGNLLTFTIENGLAAIVFAKGGVSTPGTNDQNMYDYRVLPAGGIAHDDGLKNPNTQGLSHVDFCLIPLPKGSILVYKDDQTGTPVEDAIFSVKNDEDVEVGPITTDENGFACVGDLPFGDYDVTETDAPDGWLPDPDTETVTVDSASTCDDRLEGADPADADATFTNTLLGSLLVLKTDGTEPLDGAVFSVKDSEDTEIDGPYTSGDDGPGLFCVDGLVYGDEYTVTETDAPDNHAPDPVNPKTHVINSSDDCATRLAAIEVDPDLTFVNMFVETGSITVVKQVDCEDCETRTIGYYFNTADQHEEETNGLFADLGGIMADGILFTNVDQVQQYRADDQDGTSDGHNGLSARGQLTLQYLAAQLNVARNGEECDLASRVYNNPDSPFDGWTVQEILDEADLAFAGASIYSDQDIKSALDDINNSSHEEDNPLSCEGSENGTLDGVTFDLFLEEDYPDGDPVDSQTTAGGGLAVFDDLELDQTYVLVESGFPEGMTCEIVDVIGEGLVFTLNDDGSVTIELTANDPDITLTVVNDCDEGGGEEELGSITIIKNAVPDAAQDFAFTSTIDGFGNFLLDDDGEATLPNQWTFSGLAADTYTVTETATAGWTLTSIICSEGGIGTIGSRTANIELTGAENVTCTFVNTQDSVTPQGGSITIIKNAVPDSAQDFGFTTTGATLTAFSLDDDANATLSNQRTFTGLAAGAYTVRETEQAGWTLTSITCSTGGSGNTGTRTASITLVGTENVTCTFVNTQQGGGTLPGTTPRGGTLGGNPVPNTATDAGLAGVPAAAILALVMLSGLAAAGYAARAEVRRRR